MFTKVDLGSAEGCRKLAGPEREQGWPLETRKVGKKPKTSSGFTANQWIKAQKTSPKQALEVVI
jgi:hypothetical protein